MPYVATLQVTFTDDIKTQDAAELLANHCLVVMMEHQLTANQVQNAVTVSVEEG